MWGGSVVAPLGMDSSVVAKSWSRLCLRPESLLSLNLIKFTAASHQNTPTERAEEFVTRASVFLRQGRIWRWCRGWAAAVQADGPSLLSGLGQVRGSGPGSLIQLNTDANSYKFRDCKSDFYVKLWRKD